MDNLKSFLSRQSTTVLQAAMNATASSEHIALTKTVLELRAHLSQKYSYEKLLNIGADELTALLNSSELQVEDLVVSRYIMGNILEIMQRKYSEIAVDFCPELIAYLIKWSSYSVEPFRCEE